MKGEPDYLKIPGYYRVGRGLILGLSTKWRYSRQQPSNLTRYYLSVEKSHSNTPRFYEVPLRLASEAIPLLPSSSELHRPAPTITEEFIALPRVKTLQDKISSLEHEEGQDYRSLSGFVKTGEIPEEEWSGESSEEYGTEEEEIGKKRKQKNAKTLEEEEFEMRRRRKNADFDKRLKESNRKDVVTYLEMLEFQDEILAHSISRGKKWKKKNGGEGLVTMRATLEIKMSIAEEALRYNPDSIPLILAYLSVYAESNLENNEPTGDEGDKVLDKWKHFLRRHTNSIDLWMKFLDWNQTQFKNFNVVTLGERFGECIELLKNKIWQLPRERTTERDDLEANMLYIFLRWCIVLREAGYPERAIYSFQSLFELTFHRPPNLYGIWYKKRFEDALEQLEGFMDSGLPRFGNPNAAPWSEYVAKKMALPSSVTVEEQGNISPAFDSTDEVEFWYRRETWLSRNLQLPLNVSEEEKSAGDVQRIVLFDDVKGMMIPIEGAEGKVQLCYAVLKFLGLPFIPPDVPTDNKAIRDPFLHFEFTRPSLQSAFWTDGGASHNPLEEAPFKVPFKIFPMQLDNLFISLTTTGPSWFSFLDKNYLSDISIAFVRNVFEQLELLKQDFFITISHLSFEAALDSKKSIKLAKQILKSDRDNLLLWDCYARMERQRGKVQDARNVYATAISLKRSDGDIPLLFRSWAEMEWELGNDAVGFEVLLAQTGCSQHQGDISNIHQHAGKSKPSSVSILQARQRFTDLLTATYISDQEKDTKTDRKRAGGLILGLSTKWRYSRQQPSNLTRYYLSVEKSHSNTPRFYEVPLRLASEAIPLLPSSSELHRPAPTITEEFIALPRVKTLQDKISSLEHEEGQDYRSLSGFVKTGEIPEEEWSGESSEEYGTEEEEIGKKRKQTNVKTLEEEEFEMRRRRKNADFDKRLKESNRKDVVTYLEMLEFQDEILAHSISRGKKWKKKNGGEGLVTMRATLEIKMSIAEEALRYNPDSIPLILAYLSVYAESNLENNEPTRDEGDKVLDKWKHFLRRHTNSIDLWMKFLDWNQTQFKNFNVVTLGERFGECIELLKNKIWQLPRERTTERDDLEANMLYIFLRWCVVLREAGYPERAIYSFQSLFELTFHRPPNLYGIWYKKRFEDALEQLEGFMDSGLPRFGNPNAAPWSEYVAKKMALPSSVTVEEQGNISPAFDSTDEVEFWYRRETWLSRNLQLPLNVSEEEKSAGDVQRIVLFDDVKGMMIPIEGAEGKVQLCYAVLKFLGLPFIPPDVPTDNKAIRDPFLHFEFTRPSLQSAFWTDGGASHNPLEEAPFKVPFKIFPMQLDNLFISLTTTGPSWFSFLDKNYLSDISIAFVRNVFEQLELLKQDFFITISHLSFEAALDSKKSIKLAKQILKSDRDNLLLWDCYARMERQRGKVQDARNVYATAISLKRSDGDIPLLFRSWAEMEWELGNDAVGFEVLLAQTGCSQHQGDISNVHQHAGKSKPSSVSILQARQRFTDLLTATYISDQDMSLRRNRTNICISRALFLYLWRKSPEEVEDEIEQHIQRLRALEDPATGVEEEEVSVWYAKFMWYLEKEKTGFDRSQVRSFLEKAIDRWPNNTIFLTLFLRNEVRSSYHNRFPKLLESKVLNKEKVNVQGWLFAIYAEMHMRPQSYSPDSDWVEPRFVHRADPRRVKEAINVAIQNCPWCKDLYLYPFSPELRHIFDSSERIRFYDNMLHKKIRIRTEIEDLIPGFRDVDEVEEEETFELSMAVQTIEDSRDVEDDLKEIRRLMPYDAQDKVIGGEGERMDTLPT
ncbi:DUF1740-domain-containing protein [Atractiella rhizophila]|nr:DUF1740-domain-containing protein [Atractiella rhizophila]